jgi:hypothetical protein
MVGKGFNGVTLERRTGFPEIDIGWEKSLDS